MIFALLIMNTEQWRRCFDRAYTWTCSRMCAKTWLRLCRFHSRLLSKRVLYPSLPITPLYKSISRGRGRPTLQQLHSTTSHGELKVGCHATAYLGEITCCPLRPRYDTCFHNLTLTLSLFFPSSNRAFSFFFSASISPSLPFYFLVQADLPSYSRRRHFALESSRMSSVVPAFPLAESWEQWPSPPGDWPRGTH